MDIKDLPYAPGTSNGRIGELLHKISKDVKTIASDELELARNELAHSARTAVAEGAVVVLAGIVALIGLGLLCTVAVVALAPLIPALWLRMLIMAVIYLAVGGIVARTYAMKLKHDAIPDFDAPTRQARQTIDNIKGGLTA